MDIIAQIAREIEIGENRVKAAVKLMDEGNTIPFIARYRKEATGAMDDTKLRDLEKRLNYLRSLKKRREEIIELIEAQGALTEEIKAQIVKAETLAALEDVYRPFRPRRRTRAAQARERGLEPLSEFLWAQDRGAQDPVVVAQKYVSEQNEVPDAESALAGAMDILAERICDDAVLRGKVRRMIYTNSLLCCEGDPKKDSVYAPYYQFSQAVSKLVPHRILAIDRGERDGFLKVRIECEEEKVMGLILQHVLSRQPSPCSRYVEEAARDGYSRLLFPSLERELRSALSQRAANAAIGLFSKNLRQLLMQPPVKGHTVLGLDPAYRTGCKIAVVDETGKVLDTTVVYPTPPQNKKEEAERILCALCGKHHVSVISIGNGTATGESETFIAEMIAHHPELHLSYAVVSEAGASVYSASKLGAEEFPQFDVSLRSAISIARRLQDPLAELVKIDPKAIGVGQYQHDMPQKELSSALNGVVEDCVNTVGVDLNTASQALLSHIAGLNASTAKNIVTYREENGAFTSRSELLKVKGLGKKAFLQCAGFLRVLESKNILDRTAVHPESYEAAFGLLKACGYTPEQVGTSALEQLPQRVESVGLQNLEKHLQTGAFTLKDMMEELLRPGRDIRDSLPAPLLRQRVMDIADLKEGMCLTGTVRNIVDFGAFVDIGVHQDGLVHISQLSDQFVRHPLDAVHLGDTVQVRVLSVDPAKKRISLTMRATTGS